jgi:hypothetical protein
MRIHNKSQACRESLASFDENPIRPNRSFANNGADAKPTPRVCKVPHSDFGVLATFDAFEITVVPFESRGDPF